MLRNDLLEIMKRPVGEREIIYKERGKWTVGYIGRNAEYVVLERDGELPFVAHISDLSPAEPPRAKRIHGYVFVRPEPNLPEGFLVSRFHVDGHRETFTSEWQPISITIGESELTEQELWDGWNLWIRLSYSDQYRAEWLVDRVGMAIISRHNQRDEALAAARDWCEARPEMRKAKP